MGLYALRLMENVVEALAYATEADDAEGGCFWFCHDNGIEYFVLSTEYCDCLIWNLYLYIL